jgi:hypothetical protein
VTETRKCAGREPAKRKEAKRQHGGKRANAGRKALLNAKARLDIGSWCEAESRRLKLNDRAQHEANHPDLDVYHDLVRRADWILEAETAEDRQQRFQGHADSIDEERPEIKRSRAFRQPQRRKKGTGLRQQIIQAAWVRFRGDCPELTPGRVDSAWKWFRRFEERIRDDLRGSTPNPDNAHFSDET